MKPQVVSTRWTLFLKLLLPTFWIAFFGAATVAVFALDIQVGEPFTPTSARLLVASFAVGSIGLLYLLFLRIKWVAIDKEYLYVSNFFQMRRYTFDSIAALEEQKVLFWRTMTIEFAAPTYFGQKIMFISSHYWGYFLEKNPDVLEKIVAATAPK